MTPRLPPDDSLHVQVFGGPRLLRNDTEVSISPLQGGLLALVFGAEEPRLRRKECLPRLWPEEEAPKARHRLNQLLYSLKKKTGASEVIHSTRLEISRPASGVSTDMDEYASALAEGDFRTCTELIERGFALHTLNTVGRNTTDWIKVREAELRLGLRRRAERVWHASVRKENWPDARCAAEALLVLAPYNEHRLQQVMEARARAGTPDEAMEAYSDFVERTKEAGWSPGEKTTVLLEAIHTIPFGQPAPKNETDQRVPPETPLLGRDEERLQLGRSLASTPEKELRAIFISGEAGIGKTRLIKEVVSRLPFGGHRVLSAEAAELEQLIPLNPFIEAFHGKDAGEILRDLKEPWRSVLWGVMPSHYPEEGPVPEAPHIQPGSVPRRLFEAFYQFLLSLAGARPLVLVLEDLQWADETTLSVLEFLVRRWDHGGFQLIMSARAEEIRKHPILEKFLENLRGHVDTLEIHISELEQSDGETLIQHLTSEPLGAAEVQQLRSLAGGNPFFLIELTLEFLAGRLGPVSAPEDIVPIPLSIRQVLDRRLSQLSENAERVLGSLAVFGRPLDLSGLAWIAQLSRPDCLSGLDQLHEFRLVADRGPTTAVSHELVRQTAYQSLSNSRRAWLHNRVARHLIRTRKSAPPDDLAVHFHHAGSQEEAKLYASEAATRAESSGAIPEALRFLRIAREHSEDPEVIADLIGKMGHLNYLHQNLEEAAPLLEIAAQRFRRQGDQPRALKAEVERIDCLAKAGKHLEQDCLEELQFVKSASEKDALWEVYHQALDVEAHQLDRAGDLEGIRDILEQARRNQGKGTPAARCRAQTILALNIYFGSPKEGLGAARNAVSIAERTSDNRLALHALNRLIVALHYQGLLNTEEGTKALSKAEGRLGTCGDLNLKIHLKQNRAVWFLEIGEYDHARVAFGGVEELVRGTKARDAKAMLDLNLGELGLVSHDLELAKASYERAERQISETSPYFFQALATAGLGLRALQDGDLGEARKREIDLPEFPVFWTYDPTISAIFKARMLVKKRDPVGAISLLDGIRGSVKSRMVTAWLRLTLEQARIQNKVDPGESYLLAEAGLEVAKGLGLKVRMREFSRLARTGN